MRGAVKRRFVARLELGAVAVLIAAFACAGEATTKAHPPEWAPAHGYRLKHGKHSCGGECRVSGGILLGGAR